MDIDFVIPWVDGSDLNWISRRNSYAGEKNKISEAQYRDWGILKYWFRAVESYAPWVRKIHFVTCGQIPEWLNTTHEKLHLVNHSDYIPGEYLPTFSSHVIELNFHRIEGLAEHFVYFNDDMFLGANVEPEDFFVNGMPRECVVMSALTPCNVREPFVHYLCNDMAVINAHFDKRTVLKRDLKKWFSPQYGRGVCKNFYYGVHSKFTGFQNMHLPSAMLKSVFQEVWKKEPELLHSTSLNKFRALSDVNQYVMTYFNICKGNFLPRKTDIGKFYTIGERDKEMHRSILNRTYKLLCLNDNPTMDNMEHARDELVRIFDIVFPQKSSFER